MSDWRERLGPTLTKTRYGFTRAWVLIVCRLWCVFFAGHKLVKELRSDHNGKMFTWCARCEEWIPDVRTWATPDKF